VGLVHLGRWNDEQAHIAPVKLEVDPNFMRRGDIDSLFSLTESVGVTQRRYHKEEAEEAKLREQEDHRPVITVNFAQNLP
jgi:hypothetical protein